MTPSSDSTPFDRDDIRTILAETIRALDRSIDAEPPADPDAEKRWLERIRTLRGLASEYRKLENDRDLDEMADEIEYLKADTTDGH